MTIRALVLVFALLNAAGIASIVNSATCDVQCQRDGCDDCSPSDLAPVCDCHCPVAPTISAPVITLTFEPARVESRVSFDRLDTNPPTPDPFEILHVPRLPSA